MINITYNKHKYFRTYINGSRNNEIETFIKVQGTKEDNSECDWFEYAALMQTYYRDLLNVFNSWKILTFRLSLIFMVVSILLFNTLVLSSIAMLLSLILMSIHLILKRKQEDHLKFYDLCLTVIADNMFG
jgi:hypothetical protein